VTLKNQRRKLASRTIASVTGASKKRKTHQAQGEVGW